MNRERLEQVIRVLRSVPPQHFYMGTWRSEPPPRRPDLCGTTCCAIGHCAQDPWFNAQGLTFDYQQDVACPIYNGVNGFHGIRRFFDISFQDAHHLFGCQHYNDTIPDTIARIQDFISTHSTEVASG